MKKLLAVLTQCCTLLTLSALAEEGASLEMAFGLFSVEAPSGSVIRHRSGSMISDLRYEIDPQGMLVYANYAAVSGCFTPCPPRTVTPRRCWTGMWAPGAAAWPTRSP